MTKRLTTAAEVKKWRESWSGTLQDYAREVELARGQAIIEKLTKIRDIYMVWFAENGMPVNGAEVAGMALCLLHDPESVDLEGYEKLIASPKEHKCKEV